MLGWTVQKARMISIGALEKVCEELSGMAHYWVHDVNEDDECIITYNNPDEWGYDRPCSFKFPIVGSIGRDELEKIVLVDGIVAEAVELTKYTDIDEETGETYINTDEEFDWCATMDPIFDMIDQGIANKISFNPNFKGNKNE